MCGKAFHQDPSIRLLRTTALDRASGIIKGPLKSTTQTTSIEKFAFFFFLEKKI